MIVCGGFFGRMRGTFLGLQSPHERGFGDENLEELQSASCSQTGF